jgi:hypothetical protein
VIDNIAVDLSVTPNGMRRIKITYCISIYDLISNRYVHADTEGV